MRTTMIALTAALMLAVPGCDRDTDEKSPEENSEREAEQAEQQQEEPPPLEGPYEGAHDREEPVEPGEFGPKLVESMCLAYDRCRNEKVKAVIFRQMLTTASRDAPELADEKEAREFRETVDRLQSEGTMLPSREDCETVFRPIFVEGAGMDPETLDRALDGETVTYDPEAAAECLAQFGEPFELCRESTTVEGDTLDSEQVMREAMSRQGNLGEHFRACNQVFEGTLEEGENCRFTYECVAGTNCDIEPDADTGECVEPQPGGGSMPGGGGPAGGGMPGGGPPGPAR